jgi:3-deoxy-D-manno-octulosonate 8-phosphate phosphatase (KDO 8-P phosphatase)
MNPKVVIFDVDGVMTTGQFLYNVDGKAMKVFGPDDNDALNELANFVDFHFVSADSKGFEISRKRITEDMGFKLDLVSSADRLKWIKQICELPNVVYMGDGIFDHLIMDQVGYSIAPANAFVSAKRAADYVTERTGGDRAVAEACAHIVSKFFSKNSKFGQL